MLRRTGLLAGRRAGAQSKFPALVSYHRLPWEQLAAHHYKLHEAVAPHYSQLLTLASQRSLPQFVQQTHMILPEEMRLRLLPGTIYALALRPADDGAQTPDGWEKKLVTDSIATQFYGGLELSHQLTLKEVSTLVSPDLRIFCNAVTLVPSKHMRVPAASSSGTLSSLEQLVMASAGKGFTVFQYYRPNRPPSEVTKPLLSQYYQHVPSLETVRGFAQGSSWSPVLDAPKRHATAKVSANKSFVPPQSYLQGLAERLAIVPGNSFGRRSLMWGNWF